MKQRIVILVGLVFFASAVLVQAQETKTHAFAVTPEVSYITYKESSVGVKETGVFYGLLGSYVYRGELFNGMERAMLKAEGRLSF